MREMTSYAASLTGAKGKVLEPETIVLGPKQLTKLAEEEPAKPSKSEKPASKSKNDEKNDVRYVQFKLVSYSLIFFFQNKKPKVAKKGTKAAAGKLSFKEQIKAANSEKIGDTENDKAFAAWSVIIKDLNTAFNDETRYLKAKQYLNNLDGPKTKILEGDINT